MTPLDSTTTPRLEFGLIGWLEATRVALPLKGVEARFTVSGEVAEVELDQIYHQTAERALDCEYSFPLPEGAAVHRCELQVNNRVISARIEELQQARALYREARASGKRASLIESLRTNLFTLSLANVQPGDVVLVRLAYVQVLERIGRESRLRIPFCPGVRYIPGRPLERPNSGSGTVDDTDQVPDASRISPPRIDGWHVDAAYLAVKGVLQTPTIHFSRITNHSHPLKTTFEPNRVGLELDSRGALPDQDFLLGWEMNRVPSLQPSAWTSRKGEWNYGLLELRAPESAHPVVREPLDVYFLLDRSGSMEGSKWTQACVAVSRILAQLAEGDRVQITWFESKFGDVAASPIPVERLRIDWPTERLQGLGTEGGTELLPALSHVLRQVGQFSSARKPVLVLVTDGQVGNEAVLAEALGDHPRLTLHAFGIDQAVNDALLNRLTRQQRGRCVLLRPDEDIIAAIGRLGSLLANPVLTELKTPAGWEAADGPSPDLYAGETATAVLRGQGQLPSTLTGRNPLGQETTLNLGILLAESPAPGLLWAQRRIKHLEAARDFEAALALSREFNLLSQRTAFVAWDEVEQVPVATEQIYQPSLEVRGDLGHLHDVFFSQRTDTLAEFSIPMRRGIFAGAVSDSWRSVRSKAAPKLPEMAPSWAQENMFQTTWGAAVVQLLTQWLASIGVLRHRWAETRLKKLIATVVREGGTDPENQLKELVRRLDPLVGTVGPHHESLANLRQRAGWTTLKAPS